MVEKLKELWDRYEMSPVPMGFRGKIVDGINLTVLHCEVAANIMAFIETGGRLNCRRSLQHRQNHTVLERSLSVVNGESREYLAKLKGISELVVEQLVY